MKYCKRCLFGLLIFSALTSCKKTSNPTIVNNPAGIDTLTVLSAKWKLVKDSVSNTGYAFPWNGLSPVPGTYTGIAADYYLFDAAYNITVFENSHSASGKYSLLSNSQILIDTSTPQYIGTIKTFTNSNAVFEWAYSNGAGGAYFRRLTLAK